MFGLIMGMSAMFMVGACIGIGMTALCSASREAENMEENLNMKNVQDILIKKLTDTAVIPTRGSNEAAGVDLYANISEEIKIKPHETKKIGTGVAMKLPKGTFGAIFARSGLATKNGLRPANCVGVCDSDYRGEYIVPLHNDSEEIQTVKPGDRIAVCISGGKDSMLLAKLFQVLKRHNKFDFEVKFLVMDPGYSPVNRQVIEENAKRLEIPIEVFESDIFESVFNIEKSPCYLCARMRRGNLYSHAQKMGCNKIALGHHYDDVIETILMGMLYSAQVQTMMPKLHSTNFEGMELIRPLYMVREEDIKAWRDYNDLYFLQCACKFTEACATTENEENLSKRKEIKELIATLKKVNPYVEGNIFKSVENVNLDTVVAYKSKGEKHHFLDTYDEKSEEQGE